MRMSRGKLTLAANESLAKGECCVGRDDCMVAEVEINEVRVGSKVVDEHDAISLFARGLVRR